MSPSTTAPPPKPRNGSRQHGGRMAATPKAAAEGQDFVFCCVGNDNDLREVTLGPDGAFQGVQRGGGIRRPHHRFGRDRARTPRAGEEAQFRFRRRPGLRRTSRRRERRPYRHVRRRCRALCPCREGDRGLCAHVQAPRRTRRRPATKMVNQICIAGLVEGLSEGIHFAKKAGPRRRSGDRDNLQGRGAVLADGEPLQDHDGRASSILASRSIGCARTSPSALAKRARTARTCR